MNKGMTFAYDRIGTTQKNIDYARINRETLTLRGNRVMFNPTPRLIKKTK